MVVKKRTVIVYECERCEHEWIPRNALVESTDRELPTICPSCKSPYWNKPRKNPKPADKKTKRRRPRR